MSAIEAIADAGVGLVWLGAAAVCCRRGGRRRIGASMLVTGASWLVGALLPSLVLLHRGPLAHTVLAFPAGRLGGHVDRLVVAAIAVDGAVLGVGRSAAGATAAGALLAGAAGRGWLRATPLERRRRSAALGAAGAIGAVLIVSGVARMTAVPIEPVLAWMYDALMVATAGALLASLRRAERDDGAATGLVVDLGDADGGAIEPALSRAVGDPSLRVAYAVGDGGYVDGTGRPLDLRATAGGQRVVTVVHDRGHAVAALVHDRSVAVDRDLLAALATVLRLAAANVGLQADVRARVRQVEASGRRLRMARDAERRRLGAEVERRVLRRLDEAGDTLR